jgi:hypothetical protein
MQCHANAGSKADKPNLDENMMRRFGGVMDRGV